MTSFDCEVCAHHYLNCRKTPPSIHRCNFGNILICLSCTVSYIEVSVRSGRTLIHCPLNNLNCKTPLDPVACRGLVSDELFDKWCNIACEKNLLGLDRCYCPNKECREMIVDECGGFKGRVVCPSCKTGCCFQCSLPWEIEKERHKCDRIMLVAGKENWTRCPGCKNYVERIEGKRRIIEGIEAEGEGEGCNAMFCRCGTEFCYKCGKLKFGGHTCAKTTWQRFRDILEDVGGTLLAGTFCREI